MERSGKAAQLPTAGQSSYLMETKDGMLVRVPADKVESWQKADHSAPLTAAERQLIDRLKQELYGSRG